MEGVSGLTSAQAAERLAAEGPNALPLSRARRLRDLARGVVREPMFVLLLVAAGVYLALGDRGEALVLAASVLVIIAITLLQERRAERALDALRELSSPRALVVRDGEPRRVPGHEVVRGDLIVLSEGDRVPADLSLIAANELELDESLLTGEALPVVRTPGETAWSGTLVVKGQARGEVMATGERTELGRIGVSLATLDAGETSLERETRAIVKRAALGAAAFCAAVAALHFATQRDALAALLSGVTLAMALLPEEFPVVLAIFLALGAWRISRRGVLTRRMSAIEMLGAATVLCVDKTGTLTENRMTVVDTPAPVVDEAALACEVEPFDAMDRAIVGAASAQALERRRAWRLERDYPLGERFLAVCHAWRTPAGGLHVALKGAPETVLGLCGRLDLLAAVEAEASRGRRLLGVAQAVAAGAPLDDPSGYAFRWVGFVALADPLRASVPDAVRLCRRAGIRVVMITGDFPGTAREIARQAGIAADTVLTGSDIETLGDAELARAVQRTQVFARVVPQQKLRLVAAYKAAGEVVAMTGDGVNDAPALKSAHIGIAMGKRGSDVAREAAALVLLEDDFGLLAETVRLGRRIYDNIRAAMRYIVAVHVPTAGMAFLPLVFGWPPVLMPVHIVFLEFIIDPACTIAFEAEPGGPDAMARPPRDPAARLFGAGMLAGSFAAGAAVLAGVAALYAWALSSGRGESEARAMAFAAIVLGNVGLMFAYRAGTSAMRTNPALWLIAASALAGLAIALYVPAAAQIFRLLPLGASDLALAALAGLAAPLAHALFRRIRPLIHVKTATALRPTMKRSEKETS